MQDRASQKWFTAAHRTVFVTLAILIVAVGTKFIMFRLFPGVDVPDHLAVATIFRFTRDPMHYFNRFFIVDAFLKPGAAHAWFCSLSLFSSVEIGNTVYFCLYAVLLPSSVLLFLRRVDGNPWFAVLSVALIHNYSFGWGFVGFLMAIPFFVFYLHAAFNFFESARWTWALASGSLLVTLYFIHVQVLLLALLFLGVCFISLVRPFSLSRFLTTAAIAIPPLALTSQWWFTLDNQASGGGTPRFLFATMPVPIGVLCRIAFWVLSAMITIS